MRVAWAGPLRDQLDGVLRDMDRLAERLDWYREHYERLVDEKERRRNDDAMRGCGCRCHQLTASEGEA